MKTTRRTRTWIGGLVALAVVATPALAGEYAKCHETTQGCLDHMSSMMKNSGWVGLELDSDDASGGYKVLKVVPGSPAESAGIQPDDVLYALNGVKISKDNHEALAKARKEWQPGQSVTYTIKRNGADREVTLTLAPMPADVLAKWIGQHMLEHVSGDLASVKTK